jgi:hypothetical protein
MDEYYQNGPLPTWIGWYVQHLPHKFHSLATGATLVMELGLIWMFFLPRRWRIVLFFIVTVWQIPVILTANYAFLNYLVLLMGVLLLDDRFVAKVMPLKWTQSLVSRGISVRAVESSTASEAAADSHVSWSQRISNHWRAIRLAISAVMLSWIFYATTVELIWMFWRVPVPSSPIALLESFRIANQYGLFAVMTRGRYEIEFQGSNDGQTWIAYPFRYKPQALNERPRIYAPYQPRFDWNLWFASLSSWRESPIVPNTEVKLLSNDQDVLSLFRGNPFASAPPRQIRAVLWQYWFTTMDEKRRTGNWWRRQYIGLYAPTLERGSDGSIQVVEWPNVTARE